MRLISMSDTRNVFEKVAHETQIHILKALHSQESSLNSAEVASSSTSSSSAQLVSSSASSSNSSSSSVQIDKYLQAAKTVALYSDLMTRLLQTEQLLDEADKLDVHHRFTETLFSYRCDFSEIKKRVAPEKNSERNDSAHLFFELKLILSRSAHANIIEKWNKLSLLEADEDNRVMEFDRMPLNIKAEC